MTPTIKDVLRDLRIEFREHGESPHVTEGWVGLVCPFPGCGQGGKFGLGIPLNGAPVAVCWKCGRHRLGESLSLASGQPLPAVLDRLKGVIREALPEKIAGKFKPPEGFGPLLPPHRKYLSQRGFDPDELVERWGIQGFGPGGPYQWRLYLPVLLKQKPVSWTTRAIGNTGLRYKAAGPQDEDVPIKNTLYGWDFVRHAVIVCEGPFDAMRIGPGAVATYGLSVTPAQLLKLSTVPVRVIAFDNEREAQERARKLADDLAPYGGATYTVRLSGPDPADSPEDEIRELRQRFLI